MNLTPIDPPSDDWMWLLAKGHYVWCVKEKCYAKITMPFDPPSPGGCLGDICLTPISGTPGDEVFGWHCEPIQVWVIRSNGCGSDLHPLLKPVKGQLLDHPEPITRHEMLLLVLDMEKRLKDVERDYLRKRIGEMKNEPLSDKTIETALWRKARGNPDPSSKSISEPNYARFARRFGTPGK